MVAFLGPTILLLHQQRHPRILDVSHSRIDIFDEILRPLSGLDVLRVETVILHIGNCTYLRIRLSVVEYGRLIVGLLFIYYISYANQEQETT